MPTPFNEDQSAMRLVRSDERQSCVVAAQLRASPAMQEQWDASEAREVAVTIVDYSSGGLGVQTRTFVPRGGTMMVRVAAGGGGAQSECATRVQRVQMIDRTPMYYLGLSFAETGANVNAVLNAIRRTAGV